MCRVFAIYSSLGLCENTIFRWFTHHNNSPDEFHHLNYFPCQIESQSETMATMASSRISSSKNDVRIRESNKASNKEKNHELKDPRSLSPCHISFAHISFPFCFFSHTWNFPSFPLMKRKINVRKRNFAHTMESFGKSEQIKNVHRKNTKQKQ